MKNLFFAAAFACLAIPVSAQFSIGLSVSPNVSFWKWYLKEPVNLDIGFKPAIGWRGAVLGEWQISPLLGVRAEIGMQLKRNRLTGIEFEDMLSTASYNEAYQFYEGSLLLQVSPVKQFRHAYLLLGGTYGKLAKAWSTVKGHGPAFENMRETKNDINVNDPNYNRDAFAADFGLGGNIPLGARSSVKVEGRFQYSLSNLVANGNVDARINPLILTVGYLHRL